MRILVIEASDHSAEVLSRALREEGHAVDRACSMCEARHMALSSPYAAIVLDPVLPDGDGVGMCRGLRHQGVVAPILVVRDMTGPEFIIQALDGGANDVMSRPLHIGEFLARMRSLLRQGQASDSTLRFADVELDLLRRRATRGGRVLDLRPKELALLECLLRRPERVMTRSLIAEHVWDVNFDAGTNLIEVYISNLRKSLGEPPLIRTVPGSGYMLTTLDDGPTRKGGASRGWKGPEMTAGRRAGAVCAPRWPADAD